MLLARFTVIARLVIPVVSAQPCDFKFTPLWGSDLTTGTGIGTSFRSINDAGQLAANNLTGSPGFFSSFGLVRAHGVNFPQVFPGSRPASTGTFLTGQNNVGQLVGFTTPATAILFLIQDANGPREGDHGFILNGAHLSLLDDAGSPSGQYTTIDYPGSLGTRLQGINDKGDVVGTYLGTGGSLDWHAFKWSRGTATRIFSTEPSTYSKGYGINNNGQIVGYVVGDQGPTAFGVSPQGSYTLLAPPNATFSGAYGVNDAGDIVGNAGTHGFLLHNGVFNLFDAPSPRQPTGTVAYSINNAGQIIGAVGEFVGFFTSCQPGVAKAISVISGAAQTVNVGSAAPAALIVKIVDTAGYGLPGIKVQFNVSSGSGILSQNSVITETDGTASTTLTAVTSPGPITVMATAPGLPPASLKVVLGPPYSVGIVDGNNQSGPAGTTLPKPLALQVADRDGSGLPGIPVTFSVFSGSAQLSPVVATSDSAGIARTTLTLGTTAGPVIVRASVNGFGPASFTATVIDTLVPKFIGFRNAASGELKDSTHGAAPNTFLSVYASNLGSRNSAGTLFPATDYQGVQVLFNGVPAPLYDVLPTANFINLVVPSELPETGTSIVTIKNAAGLSQNITLTMAPTDVGIFRLFDPTTPTRQIGAATFAGTRWLVLPDSTAVAFKLSNCATSTPLQLCAQPAKPGDAIVLFFTGGGKATPDGDPNGRPVSTGSFAPADGSVIYRTVVVPTLTIGGIAAPVLFSGIAPGTAAEYQLNTVIPLDVQLGDDVPLVLTFGNNTDKVTISIRVP